jgi:two-component system sensor kinase FixL
VIIERAIIDAAAQAIVTFISEGTVETCNRAAASLFGYEPSEIVGCNFRLLFNPSLSEREEVFLQATLQGKRDGVIEKKLTGLPQEGSAFAV